MRDRVVRAAAGARSCVPPRARPQACLTPSGPPATPPSNLSGAPPDPQVDVVTDVLFAYRATSS